MIDHMTYHMTTIRSHVKHHMTTHPADDLDEDVGEVWFTEERDIR